MPTFVPVGYGPIDIQNIKVKGEGLSMGDVQVFTIDDGSATDRNFIWLPAEEATMDDYGVDHACWLDEKYWGEAEYEFQEGEAFMLNNGTMEDGVQICYSGEVFDGATLVPISANNYSLSGNMTPLDYNIQRFIVEGEGLSMGDVQLFTIDDGSATDRNFIWLPAEEATMDDYGVDHACWLDEKYWGEAEYEFKAGEGFMVNNGTMSDGVFFKMPNPLE